MSPRPMIVVNHEKLVFVAALLSLGACVFLVMSAWFLIVAIRIECAVPRQATVTRLYEVTRNDPSGRRRGGTYTQQWVSWREPTGEMGSDVVELETWHSLRVNGAIEVVTVDGKARARASSDSGVIGKLISLCISVLLSAGCCVFWYFWFRRRTAVEAIIDAKFG